MNILINDSLCTKPLFFLFALGLLCSLYAATSIKLVKQNTDTVYTYQKKSYDGIAKYY